MTDLWDLERRLWLEGVGGYEETMADECIMAFTPMGIVGRAAILESLRNAPRWSVVDFDSQVHATHGQGTVVLAYKAKAVRDGDDAYLALCTSTYVFDGERWCLVQHQQTPVPEQ